jgi:hypothetical protein
VCFSGDGKINQNGTPFVVNLTGTTENDSNTMSQLSTDYSVIWSDLKNYYNLMVSNRLIIESLPGNGFSADTPIMQSIHQQVFYTLFSDDILDAFKIQTFITNLCQNITSNSFQNHIADIVADLATRYDIEQRNSLPINWSSSVFNYYKNYNPVDIFDGKSLKEKERKMTYSSQNISQNYTEELKKIYSSVNSNENQSTFNGKKTFD